jgi:hypothetical protein
VLEAGEAPSGPYHATSGLNRMDKSHLNTQPTGSKLAAEVPRTHGQR